MRIAKTQGVKGVSFHAGSPRYDKEQGGTRPYHWAESIYQKPERHAQQKEYRLALVGDYSMVEVPRVELFLGPCDDLITIIKRKECEQAAALKRYESTGRAGGLP